MATIGELAVNIVANTRGLSRGSRKARKEFKAIANTAKKTLRTIRNVGVGLTGIGAVGVVAGLRQAAIELDSIAKTSDKLGIASEKLMGLRHAAELTGVSSNTLDMALQRMTRRVAEAAQGTGEAVKALKELGIDARAFAQLGIDQQFSILADKMKGVATQGDRVRLSMKLFDSEGVALVNTLGLGSAGLAEMQKEANDLGIAIDRNALKKVEEMNDAITRMKSALGGVGIAIVIEMAPSVQETIDGLVQAYKESKQGNAGKGGYFDKSFWEGVKGSAIGRGLNWARENSSIYQWSEGQARRTFGGVAMGSPGRAQTIAGVDVTQPFSASQAAAVNASRASQARTEGGAFFKGAINILKSAGPKIAGMAGGVIGAGASIAGISANALGATGLVGMRDSVRSQQALAGETQQPKGGRSTITFWSVALRRHSAKPAGTCNQATQPRSTRRKRRSRGTA